MAAMTNPEPMALTDQIVTNTLRQATNEDDKVISQAVKDACTVLCRPPHFLAGDELQLLATFVTGFMPQDAFESTQPTWVPAAIRLAHFGNDTDAATLSLRALALFRCGIAYADSRMTMTGRRTYGQALRALQRTLKSGKREDLDVAIASCRFLTYFEAFTKNGNALEPDMSWTVHQAGLEQLLLASGRKLDDELLQGLTDTLMRQAIALRQSPKLKMPAVNSTEGIVYQMGIHFAGLLEKLGTAVQARSAITRKRSVHDVLLKLVKLDQRLQSWYLRAELSKNAPVLENTDAGDKSFRYENLGHAQSTVVHWALRILISRTITESAPKTLVIVKSSEKADEDLTALLANYCTSQRSDMALNIIRSAWFFATERYFANGFLRYSFAYRHAVDALLEDPKAIERNPWLRRIPLGVFDEHSVPIHGLPPPSARPKKPMCTMTKFVKAHFNQLPVH